MEVRLITVKEDFEKAYSLIKTKIPNANFYDFNLQHDGFQNKRSDKLAGVFENNKCLGVISYRIVKDKNFEKLLEVSTMSHINIASYRALMNLLDEIAKDEECSAIKICKANADKIDYNLLSRLDSFIKRMV